MAQFDRREVLVASLGAGALAQARPSFARRLPRDSGSATIANLRVCGLERPLALADRVPRFAWQLQGAAPGLLQRAFRIVVAASREDLQSGRNLAWDSGQVRSAATVDVAYRGLPTPSRNRRWWRVESWVAGRDTPLVSEAAFWETGLMPGDWTSGWLACENEIARLDRAEGIHWITAPQRVSIGSTCHLRSIIDSDRDRSAELLLAAVELDGLWLNGEPLISAQDEPVSWTTMASFALPLRRGPNVIAASVKRGRGFGAQPAMLASIVRLDGAAGPRLSSSSGWKASLDAPEGWQSPDFGDETWADAAPVTAKVTGEPWPAYPAVYLRRSFTLSRTVRSARLYATALGVYDAWLNGRPVSDARMAPQSTDPSLRLLYQAYDVSGLVKRGDNMIGLCVGDGWYASEFSSGSRYTFGAAPCRVRAQLEVTYDNGDVEIIGTGDGWETAAAPILSSEIYDGEVYDARLERRGWASGDDMQAGWRPAYAAPAPTVSVEPQQTPDIRVTRILPPKAIRALGNGAYVFDFGQNFAGWQRLTVKGAAGTRIEMRFAEVLKPSGEVDQSNLRTALARDTYILKGGGEETWEPRFTYHGFRYVEVHGLPQKPTERTLVGLVGHVDLAETGTFRVGDPVIQKFWLNSLWSQRSNFFGLPTDCPQRDERLGWMGDAAVFWPAAAYNMDIGAYTARVMGDVRHGQSSTGGFPDVIPPFMPGAILTSPGWADAGIILPHTAWRQYGDTGIIRDNWEAMEAYMAFILAKNPDHLWTKSRGADYGDWLAVDGKTPGEATTPKDLIGTAFWAADAAMMAEMARALGNTTDADRYDALFRTLRSAFNAAYVGADGTIGNGSQTSYILPIRFGLLSDEARRTAGRKLAANIASRGNKLSTGFLGTPHILDALAESGEEAMAVTLLVQRDYPSWGYMVEHGATTMWERWNSDRGDVGMNSYNHYAFGAIGSFLYRRIAGIAAAEPGFARARIAPIFDRRLGNAGADYRSAHGLIRTDWRYEGDRIKCDVALPANVSAEFVIPETIGTVDLDGKRLAMQGGAGGPRSIEIGPGPHAFVCTLARGGDA